MVAIIFKPARTAMQSGKGNTEKWVLAYEPEKPRTVEPLMGYTSSSDMHSQITLRFDTLEEATAYAQKAGIPYRIEVPHEPRRRRISYTDNFRYDRKEPWSH
jgi:hypothetical protein